MAIDSNGIYQYTAGDVVNSWPAFMNLGMSSVSSKFAGYKRNHIYTAANQAGADAVRTANGSSADAPLFVFRTDTNKLMYHNGSAWAEVAPQPTAAPVEKNIKSGTASFGAVAGSSTLEKTITFASSITAADWIPSVTLRGSRDSIDRLAATIFDFTDTQMKVVTKNFTSGAATGTGYIDWILVKKGE